MISSRSVVAARALLCCTGRASPAAFSHGARYFSHGARYFSHGARSASTAAQEHIVNSPAPKQSYPSGNFTEYVLKDCHRFQDLVALECSMTGGKTTFANLRDQVSRWGGYLNANGLKKGDVVAIVSPNVNEYSPIVFGTIAVGCVTTGLNPTSTAEEIAFQLKDSDAKLVVFFSLLEPVIRQALALLQKDLPLVAVGLPTTTAGMLQAKDIFLDERIPFATPLGALGSEPMSLMYSSGTTGRPKGAIVTHDSASAALAMYNHPIFLPPVEVTEEHQPSFLMILPMFHVGGLMGVHPVGLQHGIKQVNYAKFDPVTYMQAISKYKITELHIAPALLNFLAYHPEVNADLLKHVNSVLCGTAPMPNSAKAAFMEKVGRPIIFQQVYGMTELLAAIIDPVEENRPGYAGKLLPGVQAKVVDLTDGVTTLPALTDGEVWIRSEARMKGYLNNPKATAQTIDSDGWLHTGDVGHYDQDGFFRFTDRIKELVKVKGFQVSPSEVEDVIMQLPEVAEASVVGVPHDRLGEAPRAYVVVKAPLDPQKVTDWVGQKLAKHKHLAGGVVFLAALPRNTTGKVLKKTLQQMAKEGK